jgi:hypothetical protein
LPGSGFGSISFIFVFPGHNSLLLLFSQSTTSQELVPPVKSVRFYRALLCPIIADGLQAVSGTSFMAKAQPFGLRLAVIAQVGIAAASLDDALLVPGCFTMPDKVESYGSSPRMLTAYYIALRDKFEALNVKSEAHHAVRLT